MATAAEIRKQVRQGLAEQNKRREEVSIDVLNTWHRRQQLRDELRRVEGELERAVGAATKVLSLDELRKITGLRELPVPARLKSAVSESADGEGSVGAQRAAG